MTDTHFPVIIIGAGLAGLSAAVHLATQGIPPLILEADSLWAGGRLAGGHRVNLTHRGNTYDFSNDHGVHAVWGAYLNMQAMLQRFTDTQLIVSDGEEWINRWQREVRRIEAGNAIRSRWIPAPFHHLQLLLHPHIWSTIAPWDFLSLPGFMLSILLTVGVDPLREQRAWDGLLMHEYFRGWTPNLRTTFEGLGVNLLAAPRNEIDFAAFIAAIRFYTMLRRDAWRMAYLPADSDTSVIQPLLDTIADHEGQLLLGVTAQRLERDGEEWRIVVEDAKRGGLRSLRAKHVILAMDAPATERLLLSSSQTHSEAQALIFPRALRNNVVRLWFDAAPPPGTYGGMLTGDFLPDNFFWLHRLYPDYVRWHEATGGSAIEMHVYGTDDLLDQSDAHWLVLATSEVQRAFPNLRGKFLYGEVRRNSKTQTRFRIPTAQSLHVHTPWQALYACGDWIGYDTTSFWMERSVTTGIAAANAVLSAEQRQPYEILQPPAPELPVRLLEALIGVGRRAFAPLVRVLRRR